MDSPQVLEGVVGEIEDDGRGDGADDIDDGAEPAEGYFYRDVENEQYEQEAGDPDGAPAHPLFHRCPFRYPEWRWSGSVATWRGFEKRPDSGVRPLFCHRAQ